jgi:V/A-type H+-transporting ATPase subunit I
MGNTYFYVFQHIIVPPLEGKDVLRPIPMVKIRAVVYEDYINNVLCELGKLKSVHFVDLKNKLDRFKGYVKPVEASETIFRYSNLVSRVYKIMESMGISGPRRTGEYVTVNIGKLLDEAEKEIEEIERSYRTLSEEVSAIEKTLSAPELYEERREELEKTLKEKRLELEKFSEGVASRLITLRTSLEFGLKLENTKLLFGRTFKTFIFEAWVPEDKSANVVKVLKEASEGLAIFETLKAEREHAEEHEPPPVLYRFPSFLEPFEKLVESFSTQSYYEINPAPIMAITFPVLFGVMFADIGQAAILAVSGLIFSIFRRRLKRRGAEPSGLTGMVLSAGELLFLCGLSGMFWGLLFGEVFGSHEILGMHIHPLELATVGKEIHIGGFIPSEDIIAMFHLALFIGSIHLMLGLTLNLLNKLLMKEYREAVSVILWMWFYSGAAYAVFNFGSHVAFDFEFWLLNPHLLIVPLILMIIVEGLLRRIEGLSHSFMALIESMSHTVSYGRLLALTLIHASMSKMFLNVIPGLGGIISGTLLALILEGIIIFVHTLRLHWVEWFSKFYSGGEVKYTPFEIIVDVSLAEVR